MKTHLQSLLLLATQARSHVEALAHYEEGTSDLSGYCGIASLYLQRLATAADIPTQLVVGVFLSYDQELDTYVEVSGHAWLECEEHIVDLTVTQFANISTGTQQDFRQPVYLSSIDNPHYEVSNIDDDAYRCIVSWYEEDLNELCKQLKSQRFSDPALDIAVAAV